MADSILKMAESDVVCNCNNITKGAIVKAIQEKGFRSREEVSFFTRASANCGCCAQQVTDLVNQYQPKQGISAPQSFEPRQYPRNLDVARIKKEGLELDMPRIRRAGARALNDDDFYRLKTYGVCSQKHPEFFMMRIRIPGGRLTGAQLECLAEVARRYGRGWGHLTTRQDMELHWVRLEKIEQIWEELEAVGLTTRSSCGHTLRNVAACPHAAIAPESVADVRLWAKAVSDYFVSRSSWINHAMPNRLNIFFAGCAQCVTHASINDIGFVAAPAPPGKDRASSYGFRMWVGGSLGSFPVLGFLLKDFLTPEEVLPACQTIFQLHMQFGGRQKGKTRLKFLIEEVGRKRFEELFDEVFACKKALPENRLDSLKLAESPSQPAAAPFSLVEWMAQMNRKELPAGWSAQRQPGYNCCTLELPLGEIRAKQLAALARVVRRNPGMEVCLNMDQNAELHWVRRGQIREVQAALAAAGLTIRGHREGPRVVACPGTQFCVLAVTNSQGAARDLLNQITPKNQTQEQLFRRLTIHISGCPNSCARQQIADIGLTGGMAPLGDYRRYSYQLTVGGGLEGNPVLARVVRKGLTEEMVVPAIQALLDIATENMRQEETFLEWVGRMGAEAISRRLEGKLAPQLPAKVARLVMTPEIAEAS